MHRIFKNMKRTTAARQARAAYESKAIAAGHGSELESHMWRFRRLVRDEMYALASTYPSLTWKELPTKQIHTIKERVNAQLREEGIPEVGEDLMFYQMEISLMAYKIRTNREEKEEAE
ncbi:hypothetical protein BU26DRAFT_106237 [Trematosphaeria pertusa]|uniref:Uncharacterized protein n=1 Tax=Trematosphaeria pertusa TaxID=390896 RepID=A0A6A6I191_9PLEO|nr:uncharacterized protein BU26DRAFT_106237 [Trematosphaeria pertusa]KAF2243643.1 hypothetical protein BU26DRAFT_106237 [Trematosphaeria pertusa]